MLPNLEDKPRPKSFLQKRKKASAFALAFTSAERPGFEPGRRLPADRLAICSVTTPAPLLLPSEWFRRSGDKVTIKPCQNKKNAYLTSLNKFDQNPLTTTSMKKVLILSVFAFFAFAASAQSDASTSSKSTTSQVADTKPAAEGTTKNVALGGTTSTEKAASSSSSKSSCSKDAKSGAKDGKASCCAGKSASSCSSKDAKEGDTKSSCCAGKSAESCSKGKKEGEAPKKD